MNVIDSSAWLSYFAGDENSANFAKAIENTEKLLVPSITITEVFKCIVRQKDELVALEVIAHMKQGRVVMLDESIAVDAAVFGLKYKLPLADSIIYATGAKFRALIWTQDADFKNLPNVKHFPKTSTNQ